MHSVFSSIREGMTVVDRDGDKIGTIETFRASDEDPSRPGPATAGHSAAADDRQDFITATLADIFAPDDNLPSEMQEKLLREGFIRLDADGLFASDRYIVPEQVERVESDQLVLAVRKKDLLKA
jgi:hypothetical protein